MNIPFMYTYMYRPFTL